MLQIYALNYTPILVKISDLNLFWNHLKLLSNKTLLSIKNNINKFSASCCAWQIIFRIFLFIKNKVFVLRNASRKSKFYIFIQSRFSRVSEKLQSFWIQILKERWSNYILILFWTNRLEYWMSNQRLKMTTTFSSHRKSFNL